MKESSLAEFRIGRQFRGRASRVPLLLLLAITSLAMAQLSPYQPKFPGDPARSDDEAGALGYMRTTIRAQEEFKKKHGAYATSLQQLVNTGSFTRRMTHTERGEYTVSFKGTKDCYKLTLTPETLGADHRSFYAQEDAKIHADEEKPADETSPVVK
jgi:hypothetical protein